MLLYQDARGHYLAVPSGLRFAPVCGYRACFAGQDVPDIICAAYVREYGGAVLRECDVIVLEMPLDAGAASASRQEPKLVSCELRSCPAGRLAGTGRRAPGAR